MRPHRALNNSVAVAALLWVSTADAEAVLEVQPGVARPGDAVLISIRGSDATPTGRLGDATLQFVPGAGGYQALVGLSVEAEAGEVPVQVSVLEDASGAAVDLQGTLEVLPPDFPRRELSVAGKYVSSRSRRTRRWIARDRRAFARAFSQPMEPRRFEDGFVWPRRDAITAPFGDLRTFNGTTQSQHFGLDIDGAVGDPVKAANDGVVVLARACFASGNTVVLHHGAGLYTAYFHLSRIDVAHGANVRRGQRLGAVGKTGRVTGPHLHWGVRVGGLWVDPVSLLRLEFAQAAPALTQAP